MKGDDGCVTITMQMYFIQLKGIVKNSKNGKSCVIIFYHNKNTRRFIVHVCTMYYDGGRHEAFLSVLTWNNHYDQKVFVTVLTIQNNIFFLKMEEWD